MARNRFREYLWITMGTLIMTVGVYFFKFPNNFCTGGVSGISLILGKLLPNFTPGSMVLIINISLLAIAFLIFGKSFGVRTAYSSLLFSGGIFILEKLVPMSAPLTDQPLLELVFGVMLPAVGSAMLFNNDASSGGTDIVAMILKKFTNINIGRSLMISDLAVVLACFFVFGIKTGLFSFLGLASKALIVDSVIENFNISKYFTIVTTKADGVCEFITHDLHRGATKMDAHGAFTGSEKTVILTAVSRGQAVRLQKRVKELDPESFIMITNTSEIIGKGFRGVPV
mgnify:CR=1 FL=1